MTPEQLERQRARSRRRHASRATTENVRRIPRYRLLVLAQEAGAVDHERPKTRGECLAQERPCPFVGCRYHLFLDVSRTGNITFNFPHLEIDELAESCTLDVAEMGGLALEDVGELMNVTRERVRQIEVDARKKVAQAGLGDHAPEVNSP